MHLPVWGLSLWGVRRDTLAPVSQGPTFGGSSGIRDAPGSILRPVRGKTELAKCHICLSLNVISVSSVCLTGRVCIVPGLYCACRTLYSVFGPAGRQTCPRPLVPLRSRTPEWSGRGTEPRHSLLFGEGRCSRPLPSESAVPVLSSVCICLFCVFLPVLLLPAHLFSTPAGQTVTTPLSSL